MQLSTKTLAILKNFSAINQGIVFTPGNTIRTISKGKSILAMAEVEETFENECQIWDLPNFIQIYSAMTAPVEIEWDKKSVKLVDADSNMMYIYGEGVSPTPPLEVKKFESMSTTKITQDQLAKITKMSNLVERANTIRFDLDEKKSFLRLQSSEGINIHEYVIELEAEIDEPVSVALKLDDIDVLPLDYNVEARDVAIRLSNEEYKIWYMIASIAEE